MGSQHRSIVRRRLLVALVVALSALPASAFAQDDPFNPTPTPVQQQQDRAPSPSSDEDDGLTGRQTALIFLAGAILLFGIGWAIVSDARSRAPTSEDELHGPKHDAHHQARKAQSRAKAKRAREARRRNRPR